MRLSMFLAIIGTISGCATLPETDEGRCQANPKCKAAIDAARATSNEKNAEYAMEAQARAKAKENARWPGTSSEEYKKYWGYPTTEESSRGSTVYWYDGKTPYYAVFQDNKLTGVVLDQETIDKRNFDRTSKAARQNMRDTRYRQQPNIDLDALAGAASQLNRGMSGAQNQPIKQTDYLCFNKCTGGGHQWDFCHSKCDY